MERKTKIIATIGPASLNYDVFREIVKEGADFIRINTAYATKEQYSVLAENIGKVSKEKLVQAIFDVRSYEEAKNILSYNPSLVALSFSETVSQFEEIKNVLPSCRLIAKIESKKGVENFEKILDYCWGTMVARGDLSKAVSLEKVPCLQKRFSKKALEKNKFLVIATEMFLSMMRRPKPTRAEVSDVANAVFDEVSAVMLSEETAIGKYPVEATRYMRKVIEEAEHCV